ncbi:hypothetical protein LINPERHAP2_LOCUS34233 [Linum perenne]
MSPTLLSCGAISCLERSRLGSLYSTHLP